MHMVREMPRNPGVRDLEPLAERFNRPADERIPLPQEPLATYPLANVRIGFEEALHLRSVLGYEDDQRSAVITPRAGCNEAALGAKLLEKDTMLRSHLEACLSLGREAPLKREQRHQRTFISLRDSRTARLISIARRSPRNSVMFALSCLSHSSGHSSHPKQIDRVLGPSRS
jgi:hypothetical protein